MRQIPSPCPTRTDSPLSKAQGIAYVRLARKDLASAHRYYLDFGLLVSEQTDNRILFHGSNSDLPCWIVEKADRDFLLGLGFYISSPEEFQALRLSHGAEFHPTGRSYSLPCVTLKDPSGIEVDAILCEVSEHKAREQEPRRLRNGPGRTKRVNIPRPCDSGPAKVVRLGHAVFLKQEFLKNAQWYCDTFGFIPSDVQILPESKEPVIVFLRCDLDERPADHHTIVIAAGVDDRLEHCAFELEDLEEIGKGREWLLSRGWKSGWGIGRHVLGSQVFDYQRDPTGMLVEHYADGDKFDATVPVGFHFVSRKSLYHWGEDMPENFLDTKLSLHKVKELFKGIFSGRNIRISTLLELKKMAEKSPRNWIIY